MKFKKVMLLLMTGIMVATPISVFTAINSSAVFVYAEDKKEDAEDEYISFIVVPGGVFDVRAAFDIDEKDIIKVYNKENSSFVSNDGTIKCSTRTGFYQYEAVVLENNETTAKLKSNKFDDIPYESIKVIYDVDINIVAANVNLKGAYYDRKAKTYYLDVHADPGGKSKKYEVVLELDDGDSIQQKKEFYNDMEVWTDDGTICKVEAVRDPLVTDFASIKYILHPQGSGATTVNISTQGKTYKLKIKSCVPKITGPEHLLGGQTEVYKLNDGFGNYSWDIKGAAKTVKSGKDMKITAGEEDISISVKSTDDMGITEVTARVNTSSFRWEESSYALNKGDVLNGKFIKSKAAKTEVTFASGDENIVTVDKKGNITAVGKGTTTVTANVGDTPFKTSVSVYDPALNAPDYLVIGNTGTTSITDGTGATTYSSGNSSVFTVTGNGKITATGAGKAKLTAENNGRQMTKDIQVFVKPAFETDTYAISKNENGKWDPITVKFNDNGLLKVAPTTLEFKSSNSSIATVDEKGVVTPKKPGTVKISTKLAGATYSTTIKIEK